jgi:hypothetical protein
MASHACRPGFALTRRFVPARDDQAVALEDERDVVTEGSSTPGFAPCSDARSFRGPQVGRILRAATMLSALTS